MQSDRVSRRAALRVLGLGAAAGLLAACAPNPPAASPTSAPVPAATAASAGAPTTVPAGATVSVSKPAAPPAAGAQPKRGGSLRVGQILDAARLDGQLFSTIDATWMPYDRLTSYDANLKPQPMLAESWVDSETADGLQTLIGTGPFKFVEWAQGEHLLFTRNPDYWQSGLPYLDEVRVVVHKDGQAMLVQLESGSLDVADAPPLPDFARLAKDSGYTQWTVASGTNVIGVNTTIPPTDNKLVRQALSYALDRKRIVETIYLGTGTPEALPWETNSLAYDAVKNNANAFDLDKAKSLLAQAGASNLAFDLVVSAGNQETNSLAQLYQASLASLGITLTIKPYDLATYLDQINNHKYTGAYIGGIAYAAAEPVTRMANSRHLDPSGNSNTGYTSPQYVELFNSASSEPDAAKRKALYDQVNDLMLDEAFVNSIASAPARMLTKSYVKDIGLSQHGAFLYNSAWIDK